MSHLVGRPLIPVIAFAGLLLVTFVGAPNYRWQESLSEVPYGADFLQEWVGGRMILTGHASDVYDLESFRAWQHDRKVIGFEWDERQYFPPVYPPLHYSLFTLVAWIPYRWGAMLWVAILWGLVFLTSRWIGAIARHEAVDNEARNTLLLAVSNCAWLAVLLFPVVPIAVMFGQKSLIWLAILCWTVRLIQTRRPMGAGMVFALLSLKPTLFFLLPMVMAYRGQWRFVAGCATGLCSMWGLAFLLLPWPMWQGYFATLATATQYGNQSGYRADWSCNLWSIARAWPAHWQVWIAWLVCLPLAVCILLGVFRRTKDSLDPQSLFLTLAATMLVAPHAYHYDLCILLLPLGWMAAVHARFAIATYGALAFGIASSSMFYSLIPVPLLAIVLWCCAAAWSIGASGVRNREQTQGTGNLNGLARARVTAR